MVSESASAVNEQAWPGYVLTIGRARSGTGAVRGARFTFAVATGDSMGYNTVLNDPAGLTSPFLDQRPFRMP